MPYCRECGTELSPGAKFCKSCGAKCTPQREEPAACPNCGAVPSPGARFCKKCGQRLEAEDKRAAPMIEIAAPEGAQVTISDTMPEAARAAPAKPKPKRTISPEDGAAAVKKAAAKGKAAARAVEAAVRIFSSEAPASTGESVLSDWQQGV